MKCPQCQAENPASSRYCGRCATPLPPSDEPRVSQTETFEGPPPDLERGQLFAGRYEVIEELGSGGMGKVYKVFDNKIQDTVALKLIRPELASRPKTLARFRDEIRLSRKITHKNICRMHDINEEHGIPYITMEYVPGEDLKSIVRMMGRLSPAQTVSLGRQVCEGLAEAHRLGIVHRDLKPRNIMVDREGNARIMDFGLARSLEEKGITGGRLMVGTAEYMSPEQVEGNPTDGRSDIYSLGAILFEMVTGRLPFEGDSALSIALKHKTEPPPDPRKLNLRVPDALAEVILKCLKKNSAQRYQTAQELALVLAEMEKEFPSTERILPPKRPSVLSGLTRPLFAKRSLFPALVVLGAVAVVVIVRLAREPEPRPALPAGKPSLAILNFTNSTSDQDLEVWSSGLVWDLIAELRHATWQLTVLSADAVATCLASLGLEKAESYTSKNIQDIASKTGVSHVLTASYFKDPNHFWVTYQLKDMRVDGGVVGGERVEAEGGENFIRLTRDLAQKILLDLRLRAEAAGGEVPTESQWAYKYYSLGREAERKWKDGEAGADAGTAISWYEKAIQEDPQYALPYWGLGDTYQAIYVDKKLSKLQAKDDLDKTCEYYQKAYDLGPNSAGTNAGLGWAYFLRGDNDTAFRCFKRALELEPNNPVIIADIGSFYRSIGMPEHAAAFYSNAINLGALDKSIFRLRALSYERLGNPEEATADARKSLDLDPNDWEAELFYARMLIGQKKYEEAEKEIAIADKLGGQEEGIRPSIQFTRALLLAARGEKEALALVEPAEKNLLLYSYLLSRVYAAVGLKDKAIENINLGIEKGFEETLDYFYEYPFLNTNYFYDNLRRDPRFAEILARQKKRYEENSLKYGRL
ncbi:MAG: protein kinase [Acidobacteriota bacterium]